MQQDMLGSSRVQARAAIVVRFEGGKAEVVKSRGAELKASIHWAAKASPGVWFLVLTPKDEA